VLVITLLASLVTAGTCEGSPGTRPAQKAEYQRTAGVGKIGEWRLQIPFKTVVTVTPSSARVAGYGDSGRQAVVVFSSGNHQLASYKVPIDGDCDISAGVGEIDNVVLYYS
jgi:hypothetical protein